MPREPESTLNELWERLKLDSLPPDAGAVEDLRATRTPDWAQATLRAARHDPATERVDLPRVSLTPPGETITSPGERGDLLMVGVLGEGGMGRVLLARQQSLSREVAVKVLRPGQPEALATALLHEARTMGTLEHPCIVPVYALASEGGRPALVMKRIDGVAWSHLLADDVDPAWSRLVPEGTDRLEANVGVLLQVCNAVAFAHRKGVLHRDIKPANVLIGEFGEVYLGDWGVACVRPAPGEQRRAAVVGTPVYLAPEMVTGDDAQMDERTDVFLLGSTLYDVLARRPPWAGASLRQVLADAWRCEPPPLPATAPAELVEICRKAMARLPADRYPDALALRDALAAWRRHRGSVTLAQAAHEQLDELLSVLRSGSKDRAIISPLLSASRFGFTQALKEWPENELAKLGLRDSIEAAARFELSQGNLEAGRALVRELTDVPASLKEAVARLEAAEAERARREEKLAQLVKESDPSVKRGQRNYFLKAMGVLTVVLVFSANFWPTGKAWLATFGRHSLSVLMGAYAVAFVILVTLGRKSLLATRPNRRVAGLVGLAIAGPLLNRLLSAELGAAREQVMVSDLVLTAALLAFGGISVHWLFLTGAAAFLAGAFATVLVPAYASVFYGVATLAALTALVVSRGRWQSDLELK
ncbi:MAG: serine/threonine protein kinase [Myxococcaceae bacterium]|nr:serine/threonine protein kinase [Myxococcaceae bacterium]